MASGPTTSWQTDGETMVTVREFIFLDSKITADGDCSHEIKKTFAPWKKSYDSVLKSRDTTLSTKVCPVKAMVFPVVMYGCESWTLQRIEHWRSDAFKLWWWRFLRVSWTARRSNQSILKEINPEYSLEGLMLKLKLQYFGHLMWRANSLEKTLMLGKEENGMTEEEVVGWHHQLNGLEFAQTPRDSEGKGSAARTGVPQSMGLQRVRHNWETERQRTFPSLQKLLWMVLL